MLSHHSQILCFSLQWLIEGLSLHCFNSPHQVWCLPQKDPVPNLRGKVKICVSKLDSNSPLDKEFKKIHKPSLISNISWSIPPSTSLTKRTKTHWTLCLWKKKIFINYQLEVSKVLLPQIREYQVLIQHTLIHWLIDRLIETSHEPGLGLWGFCIYTLVLPMSLVCQITSGIRNWSFHIILSLTWKTRLDD